MIRPFGDSWAIRRYRARLRRLPASFRGGYEEEMVDALGRLLQTTRVERGVFAAMVLWARAMADAGAIVKAEREGPARSVGGWGGDLRQAARAIRHYPVFATVVILTLGLSIGGVTAVFTLADPILFRPLPYAEPDRVFFASVGGEGTFGGFGLVPDFAAALHARSFSAVGTFDGPILASVEGAPADHDQLVGYRVTSAFLNVLGIAPALGRSFTEAEFDALTPNSAPTAFVPTESLTGQPVLITDALWHEQFAGRRDVVGQLLHIWTGPTAASLIVVGVLRPDFVLPDLNNEAPSFLVPGRLDLLAPANPRNVVEILCRLAPGTTIAQGTDDLSRILTNTEQASATVPRGRTVRLVPVDHVLVGARAPLTMLLVVTSLILLLATAGLAHLYLARLSGRDREIRVRRALGASTWRIIRLVLTESILLTGVGAVAAFGIGKGLFVVVMRVMPRFAYVFRLVPAGLDGRVVAATTVMAFAALLVTGLGPALFAVRPSGNALRPTEAGLGRTRRRRDAVLLAVQSGIAMSVLVVAALIVTSFAKLEGSIHGVDLSGLSTVSLQLPAGAPTDPATLARVSNDFRAQLSAATGVPLGRTEGLPGVSMAFGLWRAGDPLGGRTPVVAYPADPAFLDAVRIHLLRGRLFTEEEARTNAPVAVIDEQVAHTFWPGQEPLGRLVHDKQSSASSVRAVIGVIQTVDLAFGARAGPRGTAFVPIDPAGRFGRDFFWRGEPSPRFAQTARDIATRLVPNATVTVERVEALERALGQPRLMARLLGVLGLLALTLMVAGIYSIVSHTVARRTAEIGVRMSLGATAGSVRRMILRDSAAPALLGAIVGAGMCFWWTRTIQQLLFQIDPRDPDAFVGSAVLIVGVALAATLVPARRASRVDPMVALRVE